MGTGIAWTEETWNPTVGCSKISAGCLNCYAERMALRYKWTPKPWAAKYAQENVQLKPERLDKPFQWKKPKMIFVNSMSDLFHELIPFDYVDKVFEIMKQTPYHTYQVLTKRAERMQDYAKSRRILPNVWLGTSIEDRSVMERLEHLRKTRAHIRFLSLEPLLEGLGELNLTGINWIIVGGESGPKFRSMDHAWAREIRDQCVEKNIAFFFKQSAAIRPESGTALKEEDGTETIWKYYPDPENPENFQYPEKLKRLVQRDNEIWRKRESERLYMNLKRSLNSVQQFETAAENDSIFSKQHFETAADMVKIEEDESLAQFLFNILRQEGSNMDVREMRELCDKQLKSEGIRT